MPSDPPPPPSRAPPPESPDDAAVSSMFGSRSSVYTEESFGYEIDAEETPPPHPQRYAQDRQTSTASSALEYSETDADDFSPLYAHDNHFPARQQQQKQQRADPNVASRFRMREDHVRGSMRVVQFKTADGDEENQGPHRRGKPQARAHKLPHSSNQDRQLSSWMKQLAYSFRSPSPRAHQRKQHRRAPSASMQEYPHVIASAGPSQEHTPLLPRQEPPTHHQEPLSLTAQPASSDDDEATKKTDYLAVAATFLRDYEANRPPTFAARRLSDITPRHLELYSIRYGSLAYPAILGAATVGFFVSSFLEGFFNQAYHRILLTALNVFCLVVYGVDLWILHELQRPSDNRRHPRRNRGRQVARSNNTTLDHKVRLSRSQHLVQPLILFGIVLFLENVARLLVTPNKTLVLFSSLFKPLILYYVSSQARDALEALRRIMRIVIRVLLMELLLILMFAAIACRLFHKYERFRNLSTAWFSLFELATTVINPSIWMPMYQASKTAAFFFIFFIVTAVFYLHSLVLSVVFQTYVHAATEIHQRSATDREDAVELAYTALKYHQSRLSKSSRRDVIGVDLVRETLGLVRPHYNVLKINALVEIVAPSNQATVDYPIFRTKIRHALNASIRTARSASPMAMTAELVAVLVAVLNFCYVIMVSSEFENDWFNATQEYIGCGITFVAGFELLIRFNPFRIPDFTPLTRLNTTFDGLALLAACVSCSGMLMFVTGHKRAIEYILFGRAIDMIRIMRFFQIFRDIVRRSSDVFPALLGPVILVVTTLHIFVYAGMALWGGAITVGTYGDRITPLYDLNNFNSYQEGAVTMFQVLVVNDWFALAEVFLNATRCSNPIIVYTFFVIGNLVGVSIMLNVLTAFFVETFVTKLNDDTDGPAESTATVHKERDRDYNIRTSENSPLRRISSSTASFTAMNQQANGSDHDADSEGSSESELFEFDVYEREGFDKIMQTVAGSQVGDDFARQICSYLEVFESLSPGRESVGWLVCDQQTLERYGNRRFQTKAEGFLEDNELHVVVSDMHVELLALATRASFQGRSLIRRIPHKQDADSYLEISASLLRRQPALSLFVSRVEANIPGER